MNKSDPEILIFEEDADRLKTALDRAIERGIQYKKELRSAPLEEQIEWVATEIFFKLYGGYMGQPYFCDLPEDNGGDPEQDGRNWRMSKKPYKDVAGFILKILGPDKTEIEKLQESIDNYLYEINELKAEIRQLKIEVDALKYYGD
jgi:hypothetical protein